MAELPVIIHVFGVTQRCAKNDAALPQEATRIANETKKELNKMWKLLEVGLDGIYCPLLLLNKKKYAALSVTERDGVVTKVISRPPSHPPAHAPPPPRSRDSAPRAAPLTREDPALQNQRGASNSTERAETRRPRAMRCGCGVHPDGSAGRVRRAEEEGKGRARNRRYCPPHHSHP